MQDLEITVYSLQAEKMEIIKSIGRHCYAQQGENLYYIQLSNKVCPFMKVIIRRSSRRTKNISSMHSPLSSINWDGLQLNISKRRRRVQSCGIILHVIKAFV